MSNKSKFVLGLIVLLIAVFGVFWVLPGLIFSNGQGKYKIPYIPGVDTTHVEPKQEIRQVFEYKWNSPLDSCGRAAFFWQIRFDPLPEVAKPSKIYVKLKSCWDWAVKPEHIPPPYRDGPELWMRSVSKSSLDYTQLEPKWLPPIKKGDIYEGIITIIPWDIGRYLINIFGVEIYFDFDQSGELVHLSDKEYSLYDVLLPNHPPVNDKEIFVKFEGKYVSNLFHIVPPLSLHDTSTVYYRVITKDYYPEGMKIVTRSYKKSSFKMLPGPITKGDTLEGSFKVVPPWLGGNSFALDIEEPPREGIKPKNDSFMAYYHLDKDGKLLYIVKSLKESKIFYEYFKKKGVTVGEY